MVEGIIEIPEVSLLAGARAGLRAINQNDPIDVDRMFDIEQSPRMSWLVGGDPDEVEPDKIQMKRWITDINERRSVQLFAVTADRDVDPENHGEVEGWLRIDGQNSKEGSEERERFQRATNSTLPRSAPMPYELAYIKRPGSSPDLMADAVLQACYMVASQDAYAKKGNRYKSEKKGVIEPRRVIMAFVDKENTKSSEVLEKAGFDCVKTNVSWDEGGKPNDDMYVLNWGKFHEIMSKKESLLMERLQSFLPDKFPSTPEFITHSPKKPSKWKDRRI